MGQSPCLSAQTGQSPHRRAQTLSHFCKVISAKLLICESVWSTTEYVGHSKVLAFGATGVSRLFGDFKAVTQFCFSGTQHPAAEISRFNTHNQRLVASGVTLNGYILGMLLLGALPSKWDHVAAIYLQGKTAHTAIDYTEV